MVTSSMFSMGPVYGHLSGLSASRIAVFMGCGILATVATQLPIGRWSDRVDRRTVLVTICALGCISAALAALFGHRSELLLFVLMACFGGIALTLYSLSVSHINDQLQPLQMVGASATVMLFNGTGSIAGPFLVAAIMQWFGPASYFAFLASVTGMLSIYGLYRKTRRAPVPADQKGPFVVVQPQISSGKMVSEIALGGAAPSHTEQRQHGLPQR